MALPLEIIHLEDLVVKLKSGEYNGVDIQFAWIVIEDVIDYKKEVFYDSQEIL